MGMEKNEALMMRAKRDPHLKTRLGYTFDNVVDVDIKT